MYLGKIQKWNDPKIVALNDGAKLPDAAIATIFRSDGSGTSYNYTYYLSQVSEDWKNGPGASKSPKWPTAGSSGLGGKGNDGVAAFVTKIPNSIGYVEYAYAKENSLAYTKMVNRAGKTVEPSLESFQAAGNADWKAAPGFNLTIANQSEDPKAWPIAASTFILVHTQPKNPENTKAALEFFAWAYKNGDSIAEELAYVPFSAENKTLFQQSWSAIKGKDGNPLYQ
ncbi:phosphate ABC transporter substrate-binding protein PstS [Suttonella ornithocola]